MVVFKVLTNRVESTVVGGGGGCYRCHHNYRLTDYSSEEARLRRKIPTNDIRERTELLFPIHTLLHYKLFRLML